MASPRTLLAVYVDRDGNWVATIKQGCIIEQHIVVKWTSAIDDPEQYRAQAEARAAALV